MSDRHSEEEITQALADRDWWKELAPEGWVVGGFTYRTSVTFHKIVDKIYVYSASFDYGQVAFLKDLIKGTGK